MIDEFDECIERYMKGQKDTLWGRAIDISSDEGKLDAADFIVKVVNELFDPFTWIEFGKKQKWCSEVSCSTHDAIPYTEEEEKQWVDGEDPCAFILRLWP